MYIFSSFFVLSRVESIFLDKRQHLIKSNYFAFHNSINTVYWLFDDQSSIYSIIQDTSWFLTIHSTISILFTLTNLLLPPH